jgi:hypothetical protein
MQKKVRHFWRNAIVRELLIYHIIFFFVVTPFLSSCSSSGNNSNDTNTPSGTDTTVATAVESQNRSAESAISGASDVETGLKSGRTLIEDVFGTVSPNQEAIEDYVYANPEEAANLISQLTEQANDIQSAASTFSASIKELKDQEYIISDSLESGNDETSVVIRDSQSIGLVGGALVILTVFGAVAAAGKGAADAIHECDGLPECNPMPAATDARFAECMKWRAEKLACIIQKWPKAAGDAIKATISTGVANVSSWAAGVQEWKTIKFLIEAYDTYDSVDSIKKAFGIRRCDDTDGTLKPDNMVSRQMQAINMNELTQDDIYIGTSQNGSFHNVPKGDWTFLLMEDGHLRKTTICVDANGNSPIQSLVKLVPVRALTDDDKDGFSEVQGDCNDQNAAIHPNASEICTDGIDNNCNMLIDCYDSSCGAHESCQNNSPAGITLSANVNIPGYGRFSPNFKVITLGECDDSINKYMVPTIYASSGGNVMNFTTSDILTVVLNNDMGTGIWNLGFGQCDTPIAFFSSKDILDKPNGQPVTFGSESGSVTIQTYGTQYGERLTGSFDVDVLGYQCQDDACEDETPITGTITGTFDGVITQYTPGN